MQTADFFRVRLDAMIDLKPMLMQGIYKRGR
jgi:hypothetical protein